LAKKIRQAQQVGIFRLTKAYIRLKYMYQSAMIGEWFGAACQLDMDNPSRTSMKSPFRGAFRL
jgi:hypothetical protein